VTIAWASLNYWGRPISKGEVEVTARLRLNILFKISYRVIKRLIQHIFQSKIVYLGVKYI